jgi:hypothetical protein
VWRRRPRPQPQPVPLALPRLDGSSWPPTAERPSFEASTYHEWGVRRAHEPDAHALADRLVAAALPLLRTGARAEDAPHLHKVFVTAARIGAGIGLVEGRSAEAAELSPAAAGALGQARRSLPAMPPEWALLGAWFLAAGHFLARHDAVARDAALAALLDDL